MLAGSVFQQESAGSGAQRGIDVLVGVEGSEHEHAAGGAGHDGPGGGESVHAWHANIHQHDCRAEPRGQGDRFASVTGFADNCDVGLEVKDDLESGPHEPLVVHHQH